MRKERKSKLMPILMTLTLLVSMIVFVQTPVADVFPDGTNGSAFGLTPGDTITYKVTNNTLNESEDYSIWVQGAKWIELGDDGSDGDGDVTIEFNVPGWNELGGDPINTWTLELHDESNTSLGANYEANIDILNYHHLKFKYDGDWIDSLTYNTTYTPFYIYVYNWTGNKYETHEESLDIEIFEPGMNLIASQTGIDTGLWDLDLVDSDLNYGSGTGNLEYYLNITVTEGAMISMIHLPVKLDVTATLPTDAVWGDTINVEGYVKDGQGDGVPNYALRLYSPVNRTGKYVDVYETDTYSTGRYTLSASSGPDVDDASAGTWYVGTYNAPPAGEWRINDADMYENPVDDPNFVMYYSFDVATDDSAKVRIEDPDEIVSGFDQTINVSVYNSSDWDAFDEMWVHVTGVEANYSGVLYEKDEIITIGDYGTLGTGLSSTEKYAYYEFTIKFEETGTGTIIVTHPDSDLIYSENDFDNDDLEANITGSVNFIVGSPDDVNIIVTGMPDAVDIDNTDPCCWINESTSINIKIYGDDQDEPMNATITITGCGVDIEADEEDQEYLTAAGEYDILISPKWAGTLTIEVENDTENMSATKDYSINGLYGTVTTSIGDDKEIPVETTETIIVTIDSGQYAEVHLCYFDKYWANDACLNETTGDGTAGSGLNGVFEFVPDVDDLDHVGFIVITAAAGSYFFYDIIDVAPIHDLVIDTIEPEDAMNQTLTAGLEHEWEFHVLDGNGNIMDDIDSVTAEILDNDGDVIQTESLNEKSGNIWYMDELIPHFKGDLVITALNNTDENEHDGNITLEVGLAEITYSPDSITAGIETENITIDVTAVDANGNPLPDGTKLYLTLDDGAGTDTNPDIDDYIALDEDGFGEFDIEIVGDEEGKINATLQDMYSTSYMGNVTLGEVSINFPTFVLDPDTIFINMANTITIYAYDDDNNPIEGINITILPSSQGIMDSQPDPVETDSDGMVTLSVTPEASGKLNVTIARDVKYVGGILQWDNAVVTDTYITVTSLKSLDIKLSKSPVFQGETLTVTVTSVNVPVSGVDVEFGQDTVLTDSNGEADFTVPDPGVESALYTINAKKTGYMSAEKSISVIKRYEVSIVGPSADPQTGSSFTVTVLAKGSGLAGASVTFEGTTKTSDNNGKVTFTAPSDDGDYVITATYESYKDGTLTIKIVPGGIPGFELLTLIAAIGVAFILLRRRRH